VEEPLAKILVVDDEVPIRQVLRRFLGVKGHEVVEAADGIEALDALATEAFELAIVDLIMPRMGGMELLNRMATAYPDTKVIVVSAYPDVYETGPTVASAAAVLRKPFELVDLGEAIDTALS